MAVGSRQDDLFYEMFRTPVVIDEIAAKPVEEFGVSWEVAL